MNQQQNESYKLSAAAIAEFDHWVAKYPADRKKSAVIAALTFVQKENGGWLDRPMMDAVADYLEMPPVSVYEVAEFYSMFDTHKCGRHKVNICTNISCMLRGADGIVDHVENKLGVKLGDTTPDERITLHVEEECLAACVGGPMMTVDGHYFENLTPEKVDEILDKLE